MGDTTTATPDQLREAITLMDQISQGAFSEIAVIARLALASLKTPAGYSNIDDIFHVLTAISNKAVETENYLNSTAEEVGCHYKDVAMLSRWDARRESDSARAKVGC